MTRRVAVVTGSSGGIGRAIALRLSEDGYGIVAHHRTRAEAAELLRSQIADTGGACWLAQADLSTPDGIAHLRSQVVGVLEAAPSLQLFALVNNAALLLGPSFASATPDDFDSYMAVNARAPLFLTQALSTLIPRGGSIVNISSAGAHFSSPGDIVYAMSKAAIESFTKNAAPALAERGIRINAVVPGFTDNGHEAFDDTEIRSHMSSYAVLGDVSQPADVAEAVAFLVSDRAARTTGSLLDVSGGSTIGARTGTSVSLRALASLRLDSRVSER